MDVEKAKLMSLDMTQENIRKIQELFPNTVTEIKDDDGNIKLAIDFEVLKQELSDSLISEKQERYQMTWPDKKQAILLSNKSIIATLRPNVEKSVNFSATKNVYIEGDNLDVLKLLRETYLNKIKLIYIDPPYNTGNDFIYKDDYSETGDSYLRRSNQIDESGNRLYENLESSGKYHTNWLNMMYPRLKIAKDLLTDDGVIFISIDDNEQENLQKLCNEIFGERNYLASLIWNKQHSQQQGVFKKYTETVFVYCKNINEIGNIMCGEGLIEAGALKKISKANPASSFKFPAGTRFDAPDGTEYTGTFGDSETVTVESGRMIAKDGKLLEDVTLIAGWTQKNQMTDYFAGKTVYDSKGQLVKEFFFNSAGKLKCIKERSSITPPNLLPEYGMVSEQSNKLKELMGDYVFDTPKPVQMIKDFVKWFTDSGDYVLDFFSGSGTTAHAVMEQSSEDGVDRRFILVQIPELCAEDSKAYELGYRNICELGEERIRRAAKKIKSELGLLSTESVDFGFRVFELDSSNMNEVYYNPKAMTQNLLEATVDNIKTDRTALDLLFQVMLECGGLLSSKIEEKDLNGKKVFIVEDNYIAACFDDELDDKTIEAIAKLRPIYACFKGSSFNSDSANINAEQIFKTYSPNTEKIKVI